jgi:hypothetical protein
MKKNLILGLLNNYTFYDVNKFVKSLKKVNFQGDMVLFVGDNTGLQTIRYLKKNKITVIRFKTWNELPEGNVTEKFFRFRQPINYFNYRHYLYFDFLKKYGNDYNGVMLSDITDVCFQKDPFPVIVDNSLYCALENRLIKDCALNSNWIKYLYG